MALPSVFAILGPLSDPQFDFDVVDDYCSLPDTFETLIGPKYLVVCTTATTAIQNIEFAEDTTGEILATKKLLNYEAAPATIRLPNGKPEQIKYKKTNLFLKRETGSKGYSAIPIITLQTRRDMWYFYIDKRFKRTLTKNEVGDMLPHLV